MFDVFNLLPNSKWFPIPYDDLVIGEVCEKSGFLASKDCPRKEMYIPTSGTRTKPCPYHQLVHLDQAKLNRVNSSCEPVDSMFHKAWFVLPPLQAYYYKTKNADYKALPPYRSDCNGEEQGSMGFIFPKTNNSVFLPKGFDGKINEVILKIAHTKPETKVFWYIDDQYIGATQQFHEMPIKPKPGVYIITVLDEHGNELKRRIEVKK